jgi:MFS family permease
MAVTPAVRAARAHWRPAGPAGLAWALWALAMLGLTAIPCFDHLLRAAGRPELAQLNASGVPGLVGVVSASTVGAVLASRRPRHPVGWLLLGGLGLSASASGVVDGYASYGLLVRSGRLPAAGYVALHGPTLLAIAITSIGFILLLTPTGKLPSHPWRWWARVAAAAPVVVFLAVTLLPQPLDPDYQAVANPLGLRALEGPLFAAISVALGLTVVGVLVAAASLVVRFRHARATERQQLRWVASTAAVVSLAATLVVVAMLTQISALFGWALTLSAAVLPLGIGAAILRYRLYDLDRIISRTLAYGLLTLFLGGGYAGVVLGLGQLLGRRSSLAVAVATLAVAAAFQPARRRIQWLVDRRFNRRSYDAARTIAAFSARLRQQVDLDTLTAELVAVVEQTMQPTGVSLWLRPSISTSAHQRGNDASRSP